MVLPRLTVLDGRYAIGRALETSQPLVLAYQAWNLHTEEQVVLQEFFPTTLVRRADDGLQVELVDPENEELLRYGQDQFLKETAVLAALDHPNLVRAQSRFEAHGTAYRVLEHHKGATLASVLDKQGGKLPPKTAFTIFLPLLDALQAAHQRGLIHGAFSPKAAFLAKGRGPLLHGFRTTHIMLAQRTGDRRLLFEDGISAPEQYDTGGRQGPWTDIYGSAATLFQMLIGNVLPTASQRMDHDDVPEQLQQAEGLPEALCQVLEQALSLDSTQRPRSAQSFRQHLLDALKKKADPVVAAPPVAKAPEPEPEAPPPEPSEAVVEEEPVAAVEAEAPVAVEDETPVVAEEEEAPVEEEAVEAIEDEAPAAVEEAIDAPEEVEEEEDQAAQDVATQAARAQATKDEDDEPRQQSGPRLRRPDRERVSVRRRGAPVLAALAVVVLVALAGAYVLMQKEGSEVAQFAHFKAQGDSLFAMANYIEAKTQYENALAALPDNEYVSNRLDETQQRLAEVKDIRYNQFLEQGDALYALGDSLLTAGNTLEALSSFAEANKAYYEALKYRPNDPVALEKGRLTTEGMEQAVNQNPDQDGETTPLEAAQDPVALREELYNSYRQQGDGLLAQGEYEAAREKFSKALEALPRDAYVTARIAEIDSLQGASEREEQFQQLLTQGTALNEQGRYAEARILFRRAQDLKPGDVDAFNGLSLADSMIAAAERDKEYQRYRDEGDSLMRQNKHEEALDSYQQALTSKPGDSYASQRIREMQRLLEEATQQAQQQPEEPAQQPAPPTNVPEDGIYSVVEEAPELIGGLKELHSKVTYPESARRQNIEGRVYVQFVLNEEGTVEDAKVIRGIGSGCDEEALRVVQEAKFVPGKINGKPVKVRHTLFITFKLK